MVQDNKISNNLVYQLVNTEIKEGDDVTARIEEKKDDKIDSGPKFGKRHVQVIFLFTLLLIGYCIRVNLSLTIVAMTDPNANENKDIPTFDWKNRNVILSAFFWGYVTPQILAGWLMTRYGPKWFLVGSMAIGAILGYAIPLLATYYGSTAVIICRVIQGASQGFFVPGISCFTSRWIPIAERGRLGTFMYAASPMGSVVSMMLSGAISASSYGWPMVFHFFSTLGIVWCVLYLFCGSNSPSENKSITEVEKNYILRTSVDVNKKPLPTPWRHILTSIHFYALIYTYTCNVLGLWLLLTQIPTYMSKIMKFDIKSNGTLTASIYLSQWLLSIILGSVSDYVINRKILSLTLTRKLVSGVGTFGPAISLVFLAQCTEENTVKGVILLFLAVGTGGAQICSILINSVDLSPNHAGVLQGIVNAFSHVFAIFAPLIAEFLVSDEYNPAQWQIVFYFGSCVYLSGGIIFSVFGSGKVQPWNDLYNSNVAA
ncbi:putative inorganic phosphate cotransporter [Diabrotica virgifera virgifera]|uniref:Major facilitator superfamily (MFS) profile domain-containing protein n=1 Tax=Diabrotica virgifera virgifera TaxID=50390 RepID=A0ABM5KFF9_DIAVI|nr:putative inorganic phosphate cotransporter [Diabrotica virgifera virgifera]